MGVRLKDEVLPTVYNSRFCQRTDQICPWQFWTVNLHTHLVGCSPIQDSSGHQEVLVLNRGDLGINLHLRNQYFLCLPLALLADMIHFDYHFLR